MCSGCSIQRGCSYPIFLAVRQSSEVRSSHGRGITRSGRGDRACTTCSFRRSSASRCRRSSSCLLCQLRMSSHSLVCSIDALSFGGVHLCDSREQRSQIFPIIGVERVLAPVALSAVVLLPDAVAFSLLWLARCSCPPPCLITCSIRSQKFRAGLKNA